MSLDLTDDKSSLIQVMDWCLRLMAISAQIIDETNLNFGICIHFGLPLDWLSGVPDLWDRNKILSGGDLSHYQVPHCIIVFFYFVWFV